MAFKQSDHFSPRHPLPNEGVDLDSTVPKVSDTANVALEELCDSLTALRQDMAKLRQVTQELTRKAGSLGIQQPENAPSASREARIEALEAALEDARKDQIAALLSPGVKNLIDLLRLSDANQNLNLVDKTPEQVQAEISQMFDYFSSQITETIAAFGFEEVPADVMEPFDKKIHKATTTVATQNEAEVARIESVLSRGFTHPAARRTIFPASVRVYKAEK